jgi:hypothetical protein
MATYTTSITIKGNEIGNLPFWYMFSSTVNGEGYNLIANASLTDWCNQIVLEAQSGLWGFNMTYSIDGPTTLNTGTDSIITFNVIDPVTVPIMIVIQTEDNYYAAAFKTGSPAMPTLCNTCQFIQLTQCGTDSFYLNLNLADGNYTAYYADNTSGVMWEQGTYSNQSQGGLYMYQWSATAGMFNQYSFYTLTIRDLAGNPVSWIVDNVEYTCATLTFKTTINVTD